MLTAMTVWIAIMVANVDYGHQEPHLYPNKESCERSFPTADDVMGRPRYECKETTVSLPANTVAVPAWLAVMVASVDYGHQEPHLFPTREACEKTFPTYNPMVGRPRYECKLTAVYPASSAGGKRPPLQSIPRSHEPQQPKPWKNGPARSTQAGST